ncbi:MATE family efflux transporter [Georgenia sp. TF02-10]|uniref:murein biosynthesis integral membrane protein MurJ n=1 Tax=Georgenia sp. TF02-10 TaxID=2917725 RepID=UPI001FA77375|nr:lipid II flippase MurJ [Georgenia sp. TF02-10]UNX56037.1 MATE family efflux transporter [Georgenia sp. TF02-10]
MATRRALGGVLGAAGLIAVLTLASRAVGFVRWLVQSWTLGATSAGTAYETANTIPNVLFEVAAGGALAGAVVPLLAVPLARHLRAEASRTASALLGWTLLVLLPLAALVALLAGPVAGLLLPAGADPAQRALAETFLRVFALQVPLYGVGVVLSGVLQAHQRFLWPALAPLLSSVVVIGAYVAFGVLAAGRQDDPAALPGAAVAWLAWGTTAGVAAMSLCQLVPALRTGTALRPALRFPPGVARRAGRLAAAGLGALLAQQVSVLVVLYLANTYGGTGTINVYRYAQAVYFLPYAVLAVPLSTAVFPRLSERAGTGDRPGFAAMAAGSTRLVVAAALLGGALLVAVAPAATAVFSLRADMAGMTAAITWFAPGVVGYALVFHLTRALYAVDQGRAAVLATATGWAAVSLASWAGAQALAGDGADGPATLVALAVGSSVGMTVAGILLLAALRRAAGAGVLAGLARTLAVAGAGAVLGAAAGRWVVGAVLGAAGTGLGGAVLAAVPGAVVTAAAVALAVAAADRTTLRVRGWATEDGGGAGEGRPGPATERDGPSDRGAPAEARPGLPAADDARVGRRPGPPGEGDAAARRPGPAGEDGDTTRR